MTAIIAWFTHDGKPGAASLYLASDSRFSEKLANGSYKPISDENQKVFACPQTPDIFAFCGPDVTGVAALIQALMATAAEVRGINSYREDAETQYPEDLFNLVLSRKRFGVRPGLGIFHGYRFGKRRFGLTKVTFRSHSPPALTVYPQKTDGGVLAIDGSGDQMVSKMQKEYIDREAESKGYCRWFWMSFYESLAQSTEVTCGGAPQLAGLYGENGGQTLGVHFKGTPFVSGKPCVRNDIEYRDELFQRVDARGIRLPKAQPHARMGRPRIFKFAP